MEYSHQQCTCEAHYFLGLEQHSACKRTKKYMGTKTTVQTGEGRRDLAMKFPMTVGASGVSKIRSLSWKGAVVFNPHIS